jgi:lysophospholipase L1-like esterase
MWFAHLFRPKPSHRRNPGVGRNRQHPSRRPARCSPTLEQLADRTLLTATVRIAAMGDSLTAPYTGHPWGANGDQSWVQQLQALRSDQITVYNVAVAGATSADLISHHQNQARAVATLVAQHAVDDVVIIVGGNDITDNLGTIYAGNPTAVVNSIISNLQTAVATVTAPGSVGVVLGNIPDVAATPFFQSYFTSDPVKLQQVTDAVNLANQRIEALAAGQQIPVIDMFRASDVAAHITLPVSFGGGQVDGVFAPDGYHPNTVVQGLLANGVLQALQIGYGVNIAGLPFSDQEILTEAGIPHDPGQTYLNVNSLILYSAPPAPAPLTMGAVLPSTGTPDGTAIPPAAPTDLVQPAMLDDGLGEGDNPADGVPLEFGPLRG